VERTVFQFHDDYIKWYIVLSFYSWSFNRGKRMLKVSEQFPRIFLESLLSLVWASTDLDIIFGLKVHFTGTNIEDKRGSGDCHSIDE